VNLTVSLSADGLAGATTAMAYNTAALALAAIYTRQARLPAVFCPIGHIIVENKKAGTFTYNTDDLAGTDGTATYVGYTNAAWDRTQTAGEGEHKLEAPAIPATITAAVPAATGSAAVTEQTTKGT